MPFYLFENESTGETKEIFFHMDDEKRYSENGKEWKRIYLSGNAAVDTKIDPNDPKEFVRKTSLKKGNLGELMDQSKELSEKREKSRGKDDIKEKYFENYSKKRRGIKHPEDPRRKRTDTILI